MLDTYGAPSFAAPTYTAPITSYAPPTYINSGFSSLAAPAFAPSVTHASVAPTYVNSGFNAGFSSLAAPVFGDSLGYGSIATSSFGAPTYSGLASYGSGFETISPYSSIPSYTGTLASPVDSFPTTVSAAGPFTGSVAVANQKDVKGNATLPPPPAQKE
jgi:hypothetical protein